jgi:hypothetical protein
MEKRTPGKPAPENVGDSNIGLRQAAICADQVALAGFSAVTATKRV